MEGGSQAQDHGQAIYAKIRYGVSSTFATGCSTVTNSPTDFFDIRSLLESLISGMTQGNIYRKQI